MADDGTGKDIFIPSLLISEAYGNQLLDELASGILNDDEVDDENVQIISIKRNGPRR